MLPARPGDIIIYDHLKCQTKKSEIKVFKLHIYEWMIKWQKNVGNSNRYLNKSLPNVRLIFSI